MLVPQNHQFVYLIFTYTYTPPPVLPVTTVQFSDNKYTLNATLNGTGICLHTDPQNRLPYMVVKGPWPHNLNFQELLIISIKNLFNWHHVLILIQSQIRLGASSPAPFVCLFFPFKGFFFIGGIIAVSCTLSDSHHFTKHPRSQENLFSLSVCNKCFVMLFPVPYCVNLHQSKFTLWQSHFFKIKELVSCHIGKLTCTYHLS